jgi:hypothetical protein
MGLTLFFVSVKYVRSDQISAAMRSWKKSQNWLSVADDDASALMFCSPWAAIAVDSGRLFFSEKPAGFYSLKQMEHELQDCGDENADLPAESVVNTKFSVAPLLMKHVEVHWSRRELVYANAVVTFISDLLPTSKTVQLALQLVLV